MICSKPDFMTFTLLYYHPDRPTVGFMWRITYVSKIYGCDIRCRSMLQPYPEVEPEPESKKIAGYLTYWNRISHTFLLKLVEKAITYRQVLQRQAELHQAMLPHTGCCRSTSAISSAIPLHCMRFRLQLCVWRKTRRQHTNPNHC